MSSKRKIIVDGLPYLWVYGGPGIVVWDDANHQHRAPIQEVTGRTWDLVERGQWKKTIDGMIRPHEVANWIRVHLQGGKAVPRRRPAPAQTPSAPPRPHVQPGQPEVYLIEEVAYSDDDGHDVVSTFEAYFDPQAAIDRVRSLNGTTLQVWTLSDELHRMRSTVRRQHGGQRLSNHEDQQRAVEAATEWFFRSRDILDAETRAAVLNCSADTPRYRVTRMPIRPAA